MVKLVKLASSFFFSLGWKIVWFKRKTKKTYRNEKKNNGRQVSEENIVEI